MNKVKLFLFDFDGVIADISHRYHYLRDEFGEKREDPDWDSFFSRDELLADEPITATIELMRALSGVEVGILTARPHKTLKITQDWMVRHNVRHHRLITRPDKDHEVQSAGLWKRRELQKIQEYADILGFFDDSVNNVMETCDIVPAVLYGSGGAIRV